MEYSPDSWVILRVTLKTQDSTFSQLRVLAGWRGGYLDADIWRVNSGIQAIEADDLEYRFSGHSGSAYRCRLGGYQMLNIMWDGFDQLKRHRHVVDAEILADRDWSQPGLLEALLSSSIDDADSA
ncbi:hypothetical protein [Thalassovita mangrovi]|uniref:Uncharacterized protein n=1 Tax=Thalassovita mangrovi TaxID=2692236 RepID=A0A6L8LLR4_9RHOB|nr:hypothetical protein [Thalassovita mangrovi]MYM56981.1 hypothetical protein [Thalassovita mangrovi]